MLLVLAVTLWLLIALPSALLLRRSGYASDIEVPIILVPYLAPRGYKWISLFLLNPVNNYFLATLFLCFAFWREGGWGAGVSYFLVASGVFSWAHSSARKRGFRESYTLHISKTPHVVQTWDTLTLLVW